MGTGKYLRDNWMRSEGDLAYGSEESEHSSDGGELEQHCSGGVEYSDLRDCSWVLGLKAWSGCLLIPHDTFIDERVREPSQVAQHWESSSLQTRISAPEGRE